MSVVFMVRNLSGCRVSGLNCRGAFDRGERGRIRFRVHVLRVRALRSWGENGGRETTRLAFLLATLDGLEDFDLLERRHIFRRAGAQAEGARSSFTEGDQGFGHPDGAAVNNAGVAEVGKLQGIDIDDAKFSRYSLAADRMIAASSVSVI
jgi:hypothetical protein